jgi:alpha-galactosidase/6-phospho-beta-glucosidase family protein
MSKESFEDWLDTYDDWQMYVGVNGLNHKAFALEAWNHQQKKIDELEARLDTKFKTPPIVFALEEKLQAAEERLTECAANYWKEVEYRKAAEQREGILREAVEFLRSKICELVIDDCGYNPENEDREQLIGVVYGCSERCEELLSYIDCELEKLEVGNDYN